MTYVARHQVFMDETIFFFCLYKTDNGVAVLIFIQKLKKGFYLPSKYSATTVHQHIRFLPEF